MLKVCYPMKMNNVSFSTHESNVGQESLEIVSNLVAFNDSKVGKENLKAFTIKAHNESSKLIGGVKGHTHFGWIFISHLWVLEESRGLNLGIRLMEYAEDLGARRGCDNSYVDTYSFQALDFYKKLKYEVFGQLDDFPKGHYRYFLKKKLNDK